MTGILLFGKTHRSAISFLVCSEHSTIALELNDRIGIFGSSFRDFQIFPTIFFSLITQFLKTKLMGNIRTR